MVSAVIGAGLVTGCASVSLPPPTTPQVPVADEATRYPPPQPRVWTQPPVDTPMDTPSVPTSAQSAPIAAPAVDPPASLPALPRSEPPPPVPAQAPAPAFGAAASGMAPAAARPAAGRWSVQVGVFAVEGNAAALRSRVMRRLADQAPALPVHAAQRDGRTHVLVGDVPDRASAMQLAARLRTLLQQDTVLFRW